MVQSPRKTGGWTTPNYHVRSARRGTRGVDVELAGSLVCSIKKKKKNTCSLPLAGILGIRHKARMAFRRQLENPESRLIIRGYPNEFTEEDLRIMFEKYGKVDDCKCSFLF